MVKLPENATNHAPPSSVKVTNSWDIAFLSSFLVFHFLFFSFGATVPQWAMASSFTRFLDHTQRRITVGRTPLVEWLARRRDLYLTTHNTHNRQTSLLPLGFEPTISACERPQTYALDRAATGTGTHNIIIIIIIIIIIYLLTAIGLSPGGSGYFTCKRNMKLVTNKF